MTAAPPRSQPTNATPQPWTISPVQSVEGEYLIVGGEGHEFGLIASCPVKADAEAIVAAMAAQRSSPGNVAVRREWLESVIRTLQGDLPPGRIGDVVFLLRDQLQDILDRPSPDVAATPLHDAVVAYLSFLRRSVNVGPLTKNPSKEAALLRRLMELTSFEPQEDAK
jgi:hypothetical protein